MLVWRSNNGTNGWNSIRISIDGAGESAGMPPWGVAAGGARIGRGTPSAIELQVRFLHKTLLRTVQGTIALPFRGL